MAESSPTRRGDDLADTTSDVTSSSKSAHDSVWDHIADKVRVCKEMAGDREPRYPAPKQLEKLRNQKQNALDNLNSLSRSTALAMHQNLINDLELEDVGQVLLSIVDQIFEQNKSRAPTKKKPITAMPSVHVVIVDTESAVASMIETFSFGSEKTVCRSLALDLEAVNLARDGDIAILQIFFVPTNTVFVVDVFTLPNAAFTTSPSDSSDSLKSILESSNIKKLMFDCRGDSDALFGLYGVKLDRVVDLQLMDLATRKDKFSKRGHVAGLDMVIEHRAELSEKQKAEWQFAKKWGEKAMRFGPEETEKRMQMTDGDYFHPESTPIEDDSGSTDYESSSERTQAEQWRFATQRPMHDLIIQYCIGDVVLLPQLYGHLLAHRRWNLDRKEMVEKATKERLEETRAANYVRHERMNEAPTGWKEIMNPGAAAQALKIQNLVLF